MTETSTRHALLREAETQVRTKGFAAFSYADLSEQVGIRKASIHHHFPTKEKLGNALIEEYLVQFQQELDALSGKRISGAAKLRRYGDFFSEGLSEGLLPLCGALASDVAYLPPSMQAQVKRFFELHLVWLRETIAAAIDGGEFRHDLNADRAALHVLSTLQGASLVAWALGDETRIKPALAETLSSFMT